MYIAGTPAERNGEKCLFVVLMETVTSLGPCGLQVRLKMEDVHTVLNDLTSRAAATAPGGGGEGRVVAVFREALEEFRNLLPLLEVLSCPALRARHWAEIFQLLGLDTARFQQ